MEEGREENGEIEDELKTAPGDGRIRPIPPQACSTHFFYFPFLCFCKAISHLCPDARIICKEITFMWSCENTGAFFCTSRSSSTLFSFLLKAPAAWEDSNL